MPTLYPLTRPQALTKLRIDLSDTDTSSQRWPDTALDRAIEQAVTRYSRVAPLLQATQLASVAGRILYPTPPGAVFIEAVEYPSGQWPKRWIPFNARRSALIAPPLLDPAISTAFSAAGGLGAGPYTWALTFTTPGGGETTPSSWTANPPGAGHAAQLANLPTGPYGVSGRNLYRTTSAGAALQLAAAITDTTTTTATDSLADGALGAPAPATNTTAGIDLVELLLPPELRPTDGSRVIEITYGTTHVVDGSGTTVPHRHWDTLMLGALAYAMWAYLPQVNDNFEYADGHLRDRVDDTAAAVAWATQCRHAQSDFEQGLRPIREEMTAAPTAHLAGWGDKPLRWDTL